MSDKDYGDKRCSWCGNKIGKAAHKGDKYGICIACSEGLLKQMREDEKKSGA